MPIITSLSTRFFGQPRLTNPTLVVADFDRGLSIASSEMGMESINFNIVAPTAGLRWPTYEELPCWAFATGSGDSVLASGMPPSRVEGVSFQRGPLHCDDARRSCRGLLASDDRD